MKKIVSILCVFMLVFSMTACNNNTAGPTPAEGAKEKNSASSNGNAQSENTETSSGNPEGEITVSCYDSVTYKDFLELAAQSFEAQYPGTKINIQTVSLMGEIKSSESDGNTKKVIEAANDEQEEIDYINKINTELMSGNGPDVLAMDIVPIYKYVNNGQLEDLQPYINNDSTFNMGDYRKNIFDSLKYKGGQYVFPIDYSFNYYEFDSTLLDESAQSNFKGHKGYTISQLADIGKPSFEKDSDKKMFGITNSQNQDINMLNELMEENYLHYIDLENKKANFNDGKFAALLETAKSYETNNYIVPTTADSDKSMSDFETDTDARNLYKFKGSMSLLTGYLLRDGIEISIPLFGTTPSVETNDKIAGIQMGENGDVKFNYTQGYGINAASSNKALSWEFIKFLASAEMQESLQLFFPSGIITLPIHNEARMKKLEDGIRLSLFMPDEDALKNAELTEQQKQDYAELVENTEKFSDMINTYYFKDTTANSIIKSEVKNFFNGSKTAEETAASIQSKLEMYFNE